MDDQLTREDLVNMPYTEVAKATQEGRCDAVLGRLATVSAREAAEANEDAVKLSDPEVDPPPPRVKRPNRSGPVTGPVYVAG